MAAFIEAMRSMMIGGKRAVFIGSDDPPAAIGISGGSGLGLQRLFMSHPPTAERVAALRTRAPADIRRGT